MTMMIIIIIIAEGTGLTVQSEGPEPLTRWCGDFESLCGDEFSSLGFVVC